MSRRRKLHSGRRRKTKTKEIMRFARRSYRKRHLPMSQHFDRRIRDNVCSSQKARYAMSSYRSKAYHRKPLQRGRPRKKKHYTRTRSALLQAKPKNRCSKKRAKRVATSREKRAKRRTRCPDDEVFYSLANSTTPKTASEEMQAKKHSVRFTTPGNPKTKETEQQEGLSADNQSNQQMATSKKRSKNSATPICKTH